MKKRVIALSLVLISSLFALTAQAETKFEEDLHYFEVIPEQPGAEKGRVQVLEFFWYGCGHCYNLEPHLNNWLSKKPENVDFVHIPAMFNRPNVVLHAKTFYALKLMGMADKMHEKIFVAMHEAKRRLDTQGAMESFLEEHEVDVDAYRKAMKSFAVQTQARRAAILAQRFNVQGVPTLVVDGKYTTSGLHGDVMMEVTDYLIDKVGKAKE
ncbi:MAG: thiol:disulfide interchange protein DsbA/DsbL [Candidatus Sedimenticola sp. PURPLELP]